MKLQNLNSDRIAVRIFIRRVYHFSSAIKDSLKAPKMWCLFGCLQSIPFARFRNCRHVKDKEREKKPLCEERELKTKVECHIFLALSIVTGPLRKLVAVNAAFKKRNKEMA
ncbi:hypothetical protein CEXT_83021 [Caerostris extrusa]|uniref:Uncharacterized protein n=1 Tax=Caerostris extrusa TaxID=172846 RepID=A0AAV4SDZ9_CAEEX|nr:hypothetical protein CEXT_83021 [Caerostris extrusa]